MRVKKVCLYALVPVMLFALCAYANDGEAEAMEAGMRQAFQETLDTDPAYSGYGMAVQNVNLFRRPPPGKTNTGLGIWWKGTVYYEGTVTVLLDEEMFKVSVSVIKDNNTAPTWKLLDPAAFNFLRGKLFIPMVPVRGGAFTMGCDGNDCYSNEKPSHRVTVSDFYIATHPVTQGLWKQVMGTAPATNPSKFKGDNLPVENVSWDDAQKFISKLNTMTGKKYRLPTEAEWEYAARGGKKGGGHAYSGSGNVDNIAWYYTNSEDKTHQTGIKQPNELGIYDMSGNVWEWVNDWYGPYGNSSQTNPQGAPTGSTRVNRGGSWQDDERRCRVSSRSNNSPETRYNNLGFRLARTPVMPLNER